MGILGNQKEALENPDKNMRADKACDGIDFDHLTISVRSSLNMSKLYITRLTPFNAGVELQLSHMHISLNS